MSDLLRITSVSLPKFNRISGKRTAPCECTKLLENCAKLICCLTLSTNGCLLFWGILILIDCQKYNSFALHEHYSSYGVLGLAIGLTLSIFALVVCSGFLHVYGRRAIKLGGTMLTAFIISLILGTNSVPEAVGDEGLIHERAMNESFTSRDDAKILWNELEHDGNCCGVEGPYDYVALHFNISQSCCSENVTKNGAVCTVENAYNKGCYNFLNAYLKTHCQVIKSIALCNAFLEILGAMFYFCVAYTMLKEAAEKRRTLLVLLVDTFLPRTNNRAANRVGRRNESDVHPDGNERKKKKKRRKKRVAEWVAAHKIVNGDPDQDDLAKLSTSEGFVV